MREFNSFEKGILRKLVKNFDPEKQIKLINFFKETVLINRVLVFGTYSEFTLMYDELDNSYNSELVNFISLMDYLELKGLITKTYFKWSDIKEEWISHDVIKNKEGSYDIRRDRSKKYKTKYSYLSCTYPTYGEKIKSYYGQVIWVSNDLINLVNNDFETLELRLYKNTRVQTKLSYGVLVLSFITLGFSWYFSSTSEIKNIIIDKYQIESITKPIEHMVISIDSLNDNIRNTREVIQLENKDTKQQLNKSEQPKNI